MGTLNKEPDANADAGVAPLDHLAGPSARPVPCYDAKEHFRPITQGEQAEKARAVAAVVDKDAGDAR